LSNNGDINHLELFLLKSFCYTLIKHIFAAPKREEPDN